MLLCSYKPPANSDQYREKFFEIRYEDIIKNKETISLSQIASNVEYIKLETNKTSVLWSAEACFFTDTLIFIVKGGPVLKFSYDGRFLGEVLRIGRGPEEIDGGAGVSILPDKKLIVSHKLSQRKLYYFSYDGKFIKSVNYPLRGSVHVMKDGRNLYYQKGSPGDSKYSFILTNEKNDTISFVRNYKFWVNTGQLAISSGISYNRSLYYVGSQIFFKNVYNDTVYSIASNRIVPSYYVNLGKYKIPDEFIPEKLYVIEGGRKIFQEQSIKYRYANVLEASNRIFLGIYCIQTGKVPPQYCLFDKSIQKGYALINKEGKSTGIVNDWDGGLDFWPIDNVIENKLYMPINIMDLKNEFDKNMSTKKSIKFPEKQKELAEIISKSDITDNPILMIVTLKSKSH